MAFTPPLNNTGHHWTPDVGLSHDVQGATGLTLVNTNWYFTAGTSLRVYNQEYDITRGPLQDMITSCKSWRVFKTLFLNFQLQTMLIYSFALFSYTTALWETFHRTSCGKNSNHTVTIPQVSSLRYSVTLLIIYNIKLCLIILKQL